MQIRTHALRTLVVLLPIRLGALLVSHAALAAEAPKDEPKPSWRTGPVRHLLSPEEDKAYKALKTDEERAKSIAQFWEQRDPTPGSAENEFRDDFYTRVQEANSKFREGAGLGWMSDRGKILLTAGPPESRAGEGEDREVWTYTRSLPSGAKDEVVKPTTFKITFEKQESGEYRMSPEGNELLSKIRALDPARMAQVALGPGAAKAAAPPTAKAQGGETAPAASERALPESVARLRQAALADEPKDELGITTSVRYYKAENAATRTVVTISVKKSAITIDPEGKPEAVLYARLLPTDAPDAAPVEFLEKELFTLHDDAKEGWLIYALSWPLRKRTYELRTAISNGPSGTIGTKVEALTLPDFRGEALALSSVTIARQALPAGAEPPKDDNFLVGTLRLIPWVSPVLGPESELAYFFDVYNARKDPASGKPSLDVFYTFEKKDGPGWKKMTKNPVQMADQHEEALGYTIPAEAIARWPAGDWRVTVQVKDKVAGTEASGSAEFSIKK